jgi:hypothetical protein
MKASSLLHRLLSRGDIVSLENGELFLQPASGETVPAAWLCQNKDQLLSQAVTQLGIIALKYQSHSPGRYGEHRADGLTLQFCGVGTDSAPYAIFNVSLNRVRDSKNAKAGSPLPKGKFTVGKKSLFRQFWRNTGLKTPPRLSSFHDYMGKLKGLVFTAEYTKGERLNAATLHPLNVSHEQLLAAFNLTNMPYKPQTIPIQYPDNSHTRLPYKDYLESQQPQGLQPIPGTGEFDCGTSKQGDTGTRGSVFPISTTIARPEEQSTEEWYADYDGQRISMEK